MPETTPLIKAALNLRGGAGFDVYANNMLFEEKSDFYAKVIKDLEETQQKYDAWWQKIVSNYNLTSYDVQNLSVNFRTQDIELLN